MAVLTDGPGMGRGNAGYRESGHTDHGHRRYDSRDYDPRDQGQGARRTAPRGAAQTAASAPVAPVPGIARNLGRMTHLIGAAVSLALMGGVAVWGYKLIMRDVNGIPVVRALEGPMRIASDNPGGELAAHTGLAVNAIAAVGEAAPPEDVLLLAPAFGGLTEEDMEVAVVPAADGDLTPVAEVADAELAAASGSDAAIAPTAPADPATMSQADLLALADQIAAGVAPLSDLPADATTAPATLSVEGEAITDDARFTVIPADVPGVAVSLRPVSRPAGAVTAAISNVAPAAAEITAPAVTGALPVGTTLVQFGAYETPEIAGSEWDRLNSRFSALLGGKTRVIQEAVSGGRTFFRLRATGFTDMADARRFCSALVAEGAECIPTVQE